MIKTINICFSVTCLDRRINSQFGWNGWNKTDLKKQAWLIQVTAEMLARKYSFNTAPWALLTGVDGGATWAQRVQTTWFNQVICLVLRVLPQRKGWYHSEFICSDIYFFTITGKVSQTRQDQSCHFESGFVHFDPFPQNLGKYNFPQKSLGASRVKKGWTNWKKSIKHTKDPMWKCIHYWCSPPPSTYLWDTQEKRKLVHTSFSPQSKQLFVLNITAV